MIQHYTFSQKYQLHESHPEIQWPRSHWMKKTKSHRFDKRTQEIRG